MSDETKNVEVPGLCASMVLYGLICRRGPRGPEFLLQVRNGSPTFPPTRFRPQEGLFEALVRPMEEDLGLGPETYFVERELDMIPSAGASGRYPGLQKEWQLYPVWISLGEGAWRRVQTERDLLWMTLDRIEAEVSEPNIRAIVAALMQRPGEAEAMASAPPSMDALAEVWAADHGGGVRLIQGEKVSEILAAGDEAMVLRTPAPVRSYQRQGVGLTWGFITARDRQEIHVHGAPDAQVYGVLRGRLQVWHKPMNQRGVRTWRCITVEAGDWVEIEPLNCHFVAWFDAEGLAVGFGASAAAMADGDGGRDGNTGTSCAACSRHGDCQLPVPLRILADEFGKPHDKRNADRIAAAAHAGPLML